MNTETWDRMRSMKTSVAVRIPNTNQYERFANSKFKIKDGCLIIKKFGIFALQVYAPGTWLEAFMSIHLEGDIR